MKRILMKMQETAQRYVEILAEILKVDVTIIDANCIRIAGSGGCAIGSGICRLMDM